MCGLAIFIIMIFKYHHDHYNHYNYYCYRYCYYYKIKNFTISINILQNNIFTLFQSTIMLLFQLLGSHSVIQFLTGNECDFERNLIFKTCLDDLIFFFHFFIFFHTKFPKICIFLRKKVIKYDLIFFLSVLSLSFSLLFSIRVETTNYF